MRPIDGTRQIGVFTKRIQQALVECEADIAVHSLKDLPTESDSRFTLAAVPAREVVPDSLVSKSAWTLEQLPEGAIVGTGSRRRAAQLLNHRPDLDVRPIRGNVQTRLAKLDAGEYDAIMLAEAGIVRLGMEDLARSVLPIEQMLPAPGQGALAIEVRSDDQVSKDAVAPLDDLATRAAVTAERALLAELHGGCLAPIAALGKVEQGTLTLDAVVLSTDGKERLDESASVAYESDNWQAAAAEVADSVTRSLVARGARELVEQQR